jgi:hypothetical protein
LVYQSARQDRHRTLIGIAFVLDRHATVIIGPILVQSAQDTDPVHRRLKQTAPGVVFFHCMILGSLTLLLSVSHKATIIGMLEAASDQRILLSITLVENGGECYCPQDIERI